MVLVIVVLLGLLVVAEYFWPEKVVRAEENVLALLLATITLVSFAQVIARYGFNTGWGGALEITRILFAWMILFGMSYGVKTSSHLGVDAVIRLFPKPVFKGAALFGALCGILYAVILLKADWLQVFGADTKGGALHYWDKFYKIGIGLDDLRYPEWFQEAFGVQERVQRWIAYLMLPIGLALLAFRCLQAFVQIWRGQRELMVASHEAEDLVAQNKTVTEE
ncbi:MAG: TRAP transporter small permease [Alphaproteobacteria bacterium]|nr:TRAP transporter small permease [Alphaproteobacteria bacterium]MBF0250864.1 TRAP transporter small permease [Alphaproteobacteria bacterium]